MKITKIYVVLHLIKIESCWVIHSRVDSCIQFKVVPLHQMNCTLSHLRMSEIVVVVCLMTVPSWHFFGGTK